MIKIKFKIFILFIISLFLISGCSAYKNQDISNKNRLISEIYIAISLNSEDEVKLAQDFIHAVSRRAKSKHRFVIDILKDSQAQNIQSNPADKKRFNEIQKNDIIITQSNEKSLIDSYQRMTNLAIDNIENQESYTSYILTPGISNPSTLEQMNKIINNFSSSYPNAVEKTHIYLIGLDKENRIKTASTLNSIGKNTNSASRSYQEWNRFIKEGLNQ